MPFRNEGQFRGAIEKRPHQEEGPQAKAWNHSKPFGSRAGNSPRTLEKDWKISPCMPAPQARPKTAIHRRKKRGRCQRSELRTRHCSTGWRRESLLLFAALSGRSSVSLKGTKVQSSSDRETGNIAALAAVGEQQPISRELSKIIEPLHAEFPNAVEISFTFRKNLRLHLDVRTLEEAHAVEARLPALCGGIFQEIFAGRSPHHAFFHRVSAKVNR